MAHRSSVPKKDSTVDQGSLMGLTGNKNPAAERPQQDVREPDPGAQSIPPPEVQGQPSSGDQGHTAPPVPPEDQPRTPASDDQGRDPPHQPPPSTSSPFQSGGSAPPRQPPPLDTSWTQSGGTLTDDAVSPHTKNVSYQEGLKEKEKGGSRSENQHSDKTPEQAHADAQKHKEERIRLADRAFDHAIANFKDTQANRIAWEQKVRQPGATAEDHEALERARAMDAQAETALRILRRNSDNARSDALSQDATQGSHSAPQQPPPEGDTKQQATQGSHSGIQRQSHEGDVEQEKTDAAEVKGKDGTGGSSAPEGKKGRRRSLFKEIMESRRSHPEEPEKLQPPNPLLKHHEKPRQPPVKGKAFGRFERTDQQNKSGTTPPSSGANTGTTQAGSTGTSAPLNTDGTADGGTGNTQEGDAEQQNQSPRGVRATFRRIRTKASEMFGKLIRKRQ